MAGNASERLIRRYINRILSGGVSLDSEKIALYPQRAVKGKWEPSIVIPVSTVNGMIGRKIKSEGRTGVRTDVRKVGTIMKKFNDSLSKTVIRITENGESRSITGYKVDSSLESTVLINLDNEKRVNCREYIDSIVSKKIIKKTAETAKTNYISSDDEQEISKPPARGTEITGHRGKNTSSSNSDTKSDHEHVESVRDASSEKDDEASKKPVVSPPKLKKNTTEEEETRSRSRSEKRATSRSKTKKDSSDEQEESETEPRQAKAASSSSEAKSDTNEGRRRKRGTDRKGRNSSNSNPKKRSSEEDNSSKTRKKVVEEQEVEFSLDEDNEEEASLSEETEDESDTDNSKLGIPKDEYNELEEASDVVKREIRSYLHKNVYYPTLFDKDGKITYDKDHMIELFRQMTREQLKDMVDEVITLNIVKLYKYMPVDKANYVLLLVKNKTNPGQLYQDPPKATSSLSNLSHRRPRGD